MVPPVALWTRLGECEDDRERLAAPRLEPHRVAGAPGGGCEGPGDARRRRGLGVRGHDRVTGSRVQRSEAAGKPPHELATRRGGCAYAPTRSAGSWKGRCFTGSDYVDALRGDLKERLRRVGLR